MNYSKKVLFLFFCLFALVVKAQETKSLGTPLRGNGLGFTRNKGQLVDMNQQLRPDIFYVGNGGGTNIYIRKSGVSYVLNNTNQIVSKINGIAEKIEKYDKPNGFDKESFKQDLYLKEIVSGYRIDLDFIGCNSNVSIETADKVEGYTNYFYAGCPKGITHVSSYNEVTVKNIYNNIDVRYSGDKENGLKYDIIVNPGGSTNDIQLQYTGMEQLYVEHERLYIKTNLGEMEERIPKVYQNIYGQITDVKTNYILKDNRISFQIKQYNKNYPLIIDPWVTYYGGADFDAVYSVTTDNNGDVIYTGISGYSPYSGTFPTSPGAFQTTFTGTTEGIILKFTSAGARIFATYIGGSGTDIIAGVTTDAANNIFATGLTNSSNFPAVNPGGAYMQGYGGSQQVIIVKFTPAGVLTWSTFYGGTTAGQQRGNDIATDAAGNIFVTGFTECTDFPILSPYQATKKANSSNAFVLKFNNNGVRQWATYYGGTANGSEMGNGIACDATGDVYFCGNTGYEMDFPLLAAFQSVYGGCFVAKLNGNTGFPVWSTYYGGGNQEQCNAIALDCNGNIFVAGTTFSGNNISTPGSFQPAHNTPGSAPDAFLVKFNNAGVRQWGTYLGGISSEECSGVMCDRNNNVIVAGDVYRKWGSCGSLCDPSFPVTSCAYQSTFYGNEDNFITSFDNNGNLIYSSLFGLGVNTSSPDNETSSGFGGCIAISGCYLYLASMSQCSSPVTTGAFQTTCGGGFDLALAQFNLNTCNNLSNAFSFTSNITNFCAGGSVDYTSVYTPCDITGTTYSWSFPGGSPSSSVASNPSGITYPVAGTYDVKLVINTPCGSDSLVKTTYITVNSCSCAMTASATNTSNVNCNGAANGSASVSISNGSGGPYIYSWSNGVTGTTTATTIPITNLPAATYIVNVSEGSCTTTSTVTITEPTALSFAAPIITDAACGVSNGSAIVTAAGGTGSLNYLWSNSTTGQTLTNVSAGSYIVTVTDANSCTSTTSILINSNPSATINMVNVANVTCNGQNTGVANISASGGTGILTYSWSNNTSGQTITNVASGTYVVSVTDASGCLTQSNVTITEPMALTTPTTSATPTGCGISTGTATVAAAGGSGSLNYSWSNGFTGITNTNLSANTYTVTVTDANNCSVTNTTVINITNGPSVTTLNSTNITCNGQSNGSATINITGGSGPYNYSWSNGASSTTSSLNHFITSLLANTYTVTVTDANNCVSISTVSITVPAVITINASQNTAASCNNNNGIAIATAATGGTGSFNYSWSSGASGLTANNLSFGTYTITATDANGCTQTASTLINNNPAPTINSLTPTHVLCNGINTGTATVNATGTGILTYNWSNGVSGTTQSQISNLIAQIYYVTVTDANGCLVQSSVTITEPSIISFASPTITNATCGVSNGSASVAAVGGSGSLNYSWSNSTTGQTISAVTSGNYVVTVTDINSCTSTTSVLINNSPSATIDNITVTSPSCNGQNNGSAQASASGGSGALTYSWSNSTSGQTITNVIAGTYIISVTDAGGCLTQSSVVITEPTTVSAQNTNAISSTCGNANGAADILVTGGTGFYTFSWSNGFVDLGFGNQSAIFGLLSNTYYVTVTDQNSCSYTHTFVIGNKPSPVFTGSSPVITPAECKGNSSGQIDVLISSGTAPYTYNWSNGASTITIAQNNTLNNLPTGNYSLTITDNNGCSVDTSLTLNEPTFVFTSTVTATDATCITGGSATVNISGGNAGNYTYSWSNGTSSVSNNPLAVGNNLPAGNYTITVTDSKGCTTISITTINVAALPTVTATEQTAAICGNSDGAASVTVTGGTSQYTYSWSNGMTAITTSTQSQISNLTSQIYTVTVTDGNGCTSTSTATITNSNGPNIASQNSTGTCVGQATGQAAVSVAGGTGPYTYSWSNGVTSTTTNLTSQISNLTSGTYTLTITDANNCTATATALLPLFSNPTANAGTDQTITNGTSIQLTASGGTSYLWTPSTTLTNAGISNPIANPIQTTTYTVTVTDANSCSSTDDITVTVTTPQTCNATEADEFVANIFTPNGDGRNDILRVQGFGLTNIYFAIYNRWGQKLFETTDQTKGWDGTQNGKPIDEQTVVYYLKATCITTGENIVKKGDVGVVR